MGHYQTWHNQRPRKNMGVAQKATNADTNKGHDMGIWWTVILSSAPPSAALSPLCEGAWASQPPGG